MKFTRYLLVAALALLSACTDSHRPVYSGHQESTEGVPGFVNGKKASPYVKLGQSYRVDGEEYVPRNQPDYVEEGNASWYGPGFHGGKTANGEIFDANELTGAHRTLPLPSIVRVTMLSTGKQVFIRINDRGPFAHSRILDMSRGAAEKIGLLRAGVAKVRVEYMPKESQRFADLMAQGRDPKSIDLASDVIGYGGGASYAQDEVNSNVVPPAEQSRSGSFWDNFGSSPAEAAEPTPEAAIAALRTPISPETNDAAPISQVSSNDLAAPRSSSPFKAARPAQTAVITESSLPAELPAGADPNDTSPFAAIDSSAGEPAAKPSRIASTAKNVPVATGGSYVQLGAFSNETNAERLRSRYKDVGDLQVVQKSNSAGQMLFHVRAGPFGADDSMAIRDKFVTAGADAHIVKE